MIDDLPEMQRWRQTRVVIALAMVAGNLVCAIASWFLPWAGYVGPMVTVTLMILLRSPAESEEKLTQGFSEAD